MTTADTLHDAQRAAAEGTRRYIDLLGELNRLQAEMREQAEDNELLQARVVLLENRAARACAGQVGEGEGPCSQSDRNER